MSSDHNRATQEQILDGIRRVAVKTFRCQSESFGAETTADDVDGWDSLSHTVLLMALEREFGVRFDVARVAGLSKVGDLAREIARLMP